MFTQNTLQLRAVLVASIFAAAATARKGGVAIYNDCDFPVASSTVVQGSVHDPETIQPQSWYWEKYQYPPVGGTVLKLREDLGAALGTQPITQLEYSIAPDGNIYYDISNVDCGPTSSSNKGDCPFLDGGMFLHSSKGCDTKKCSSGDVACHDAYNLPKDDWATAGCKFANQALVLYVCRDGVLNR